MDEFNKDALISRIAAGERVKFLAFYGHAPAPSGEIGPDRFSQWSPTPFEVDGEFFKTAEHFMMAAKARLFGDEARRALVLEADSPGAAKAHGRAVRDFDQSVWEQEREAIVTAGSVAKFGADPELRAYLIGTGDRVLVEAAPRDRIWGVGMGRQDPDIERPDRWRGLNLLGFALMRARARLRDG